MLARLDGELVANISYRLSSCPLDIGIDVWWCYLIKVYTHLTSAINSLVAIAKAVSFITQSRRILAKQNWHKIYWPLCDGHRLEANRTEKKGQAWIESVVIMFMVHWLCRCVICMIWREEATYITTHLEDLGEIYRCETNSSWTIQAFDSNGNG